MNDRESAAEHLKTIRALMERATIYRAISGPAALFGGVIALLVGIVMSYGAFSGKAATLAPRSFFLIWIGVLTATAVFNTFLLRRGAQTRGEPFFSPGSKLALRAILPPMLAGGVISWVNLDTGGSLGRCALIWVVFYSLALLASANFAPRSMRDLGRMFFAAGIGLFLFLHLFSTYLGGRLPNDQIQAGLIMALTFGALHILYGLRIIFRNGGEPR